MKGSFIVLLAISLLTWSCGDSTHKDEPNEYIDTTWGKLQDDTSKVDTTYVDAISN